MTTIKRMRMVMNPHPLYNPLKRGEQALHLGLLDLLLRHYADPYDRKKRMINLPS
jgi:hypothetical protein